MATIVIAAFAVLGFCLHVRYTNRLRDDHAGDLRALRDGHAHELRKTRDSASIERENWQRLLQRQHSELRSQLEKERQTAADERRELLNRVKPETAQHAPVSGPFLAPPAIDLDDDQGFYESKEAMADRIAQAELQLGRLAAGAA